MQLRRLPESSLSWILNSWSIGRPAVGRLPSLHGMAEDMPGSGREIEEIGDWLLEIGGMGANVPYYQPCSVASMECHNIPAGMAVDRTCLSHGRGLGLVPAVEVDGALELSTVGPVLVVRDAVNPLTWISNGI